MADSTESRSTSSGQTAQASQNSLPALAESFANFCSVQQLKIRQPDIQAFVSETVNSLTSPNPAIATKDMFLLKWAIARLCGELLECHLRILSQLEASMSRLLQSLETESEQFGKATQRHAQTVESHNIERLRSQYDGVRLLHDRLIASDVVDRRNNGRFRTALSAQLWFLDKRNSTAIAKADKQLEAYTGYARQLLEIVEDVTRRHEHERDGESNIVYALEHIKSIAALREDPSNDWGWRTVHLLQNFMEGRRRHSNAHFIARLRRLETDVQELQAIQLIGTMAQVVLANKYLTLSQVTPAQAGDIAEMERNGKWGLWRDHQNPLGVASGFDRIPLTLRVALRAVDAQKRPSVADCSRPTDQHPEMLRNIDIASPLTSQPDVTSTESVCSSTTLSDHTHSPYFPRDEYQHGESDGRSPMSSARDARSPCPLEEDACLYDDSMLLDRDCEDQGDQVSEHDEEASQTVIGQASSPAYVTLPVSTPSEMLMDEPEEIPTPIDWRRQQSHPESDTNTRKRKRSQSSSPLPSSVRRTSARHGYEPTEDGQRNENQHSKDDAPTTSPSQVQQLTSDFDIPTPVEWRTKFQFQTKPPNGSYRDSYADMSGHVLGSQTGSDKEPAKNTFDVDGVSSLGNEPLVTASTSKIEEEIHTFEGQCYYTVMGLSRRATPGELEAAHKRLARMMHPDRLWNRENAHVATKKFQHMEYVYGVLIDEVKRAFYDQYGVHQWMLHYHQCVTD